MAQKSSNSKWLWWFLGCSLVIGFIVLCICGIGGFFVYRFYQQTVAPPLTFAKFQNLIPDFPIYPNARFDEMMSNLPPHRVMRGKFWEHLGFEETFTVIAVFQTQDPPQKVLNWYRSKLTRMGWKEEKLQKAPAQIKQFASTDFHFTRGINYLFIDPLPSVGFQVLCFLSGIPDWEMQRLKEQVKANPNDGDAWARLAWGHFCLANWKEARNATQKALANPPEKKAKQTPARIDTYQNEGVQKSIAC